MRKKSKGSERSSGATQHPHREAPLDRPWDSIDRRTFVRKGSLFLVVGVGACVNADSGSAPVDGLTGAIHLLLNGLHPAAVNGGSATVTPAGGGESLTVDIPASGDQSATVPIGDYAVLYAPPANHQLAGGQPNPRTIAIQQDQTTTVTINLVATGSLSIGVTGFTGSQSTGGSASAQRTDASASPVSIGISTVGSGSALVPAGTYVVTYMPPPGYSIASSSPNPVSGVTVGLGVTSVQFAVAAAAAGTGSILVTATGLSGATSGGQVSAKLTDNSGNTFSADLSAPTNGSASASLSGLPVGSYNVTYSPPTGYQVVAGTQNPSVASVSSGGTATVTFRDELTPAGTLIVFASDWHTAVGSGSTAKSDGGKWDVTVDSGGAANRIEVVATTGLDFPSGMANCLKVLNPFANWQNLYWNVLVQNGWALPTVGNALYQRLYFRYDIGAGTGTNTLHPVQTGPPGSCPYTNELVEFDRIDATTYHLVNSNLGANGANKHRWEFKTPQTRGTTVRLEQQFIRQSTNEWAMHLRLYNSSNVLIGQDADFTDGYTGLTLAAYDAANGTITSGTDCLRNFMIGFPNQDMGSDDVNHQHIYYAGFAVSLTDWCGQYVPGEAK
jgi:hypothetical protein